jgi:hypothetical protein
MKKIILITILSVTALCIRAQVPNYIPTNGLVGWWPFNGNANDESGNGNNGTVNGAMLTTDRFGNTNKAYSFDGVNDFISVSHNQALNLSGSNNSFSFSVWIRPNQTNQQELNILSKGAGNGMNSNDVYILSVYNQNKIGLELSNFPNAFWTRSNDTISFNFWNHIVVVYDKNLNISKFYINGVFAGQQQYSLIPSSNGDIQPLFFGKQGWNCNCNFMNGLIDDIGSWNRTLSQSEITALYTGCINATNITPQNNSVNIGNTITFTANTSGVSPNYIWQSDFGQGFQKLNNLGKYSGTTTKNMSISNVQLSNHLQPIRAIVISSTCTDTSNIAYIKITDTCITKITKYDTIKVMDTLVINANLSGISAPNNTNRIIVYPNPAKDHITIDYGVFSRMSGYTMKITNTLGQTVFSSPINQQSSFINLSSWTGKGLYYIQIIDPQSNMVENRKIVLQ